MAIEKKVYEPLHYIAPTLVMGCQTSWGTRTQCKNCGVHASEYTIFPSRYEPCPRCGEKELRGVTARWVDQTPVWIRLITFGLLRTRGYWEVKGGN